MPVAIPPGACTTRTVAASLVTPSCEKANTASDFLKICTTRFASTAVGQKMSWRNGERSSRPWCWMLYNVTLTSLEPKRQTSSIAALTNLLRSEEHRSELQSLVVLVCRLLLEK